jgi:hypothetical protein
MNRARSRLPLAGLLALATALFAYAVIHERSLTDAGHGESAAQLAQESSATRASETRAQRTRETHAPKTRETPTERAGETHPERARERHGKRAGESRAAGGGKAPAQVTGETATTGASERSGSASGGGHVEAASEHGREGPVLGVDLESTPMIVLAVLAGIALTIVAASPLGTLRVIVLALALAALAWTALDIREVVHQANESRTDLTIIAAIVAALHAAAAALAISLGLKAGAIRPPTRGTTATPAAPR